MKKSRFGFVGRDGRRYIVAGWQLACGMVVHRSMFSAGDQSDEHWSVSDPVSGGRVGAGFTMGEAVAAYRELRRAYGQGWPEALAVQRQAMARRTRQTLCEKAGEAHAEVVKA